MSATELLEDDAESAALPDVGQPSDETVGILDEDVVRIYDLTQQIALELHGVDPSRNYPNFASEINIGHLMIGLDGLGEHEQKEFIRKCILFKAGNFDYGGLGGGGLAIEVQEPQAVPTEDPSEYKIAVQAAVEEHGSAVFYKYILPELMTPKDSLELPVKLFSDILSRLCVIATTIFAYKHGEIIEEMPLVENNILFFNRQFTQGRISLFIPKEYFKVLPSRIKRSVSKKTRDEIVPEILELLDT